MLKNSHEGERGKWMEIMSLARVASANIDWRSHGEILLNIYFSQNLNEPKVAINLTHLQGLQLCLETF